MFMMHYHVSGYGGFGAGGPGLPGGQGGPGTKPGYPIGTGVCFYLYIYSINNRKTQNYLNYTFLSFSTGVGTGAISPAQAKAAKYGSQPHLFQRQCFRILAVLIWVV